MWAPADLFTHAAGMVTLPARRVVTYFYERPFAAALVLALAAGVIALVETLSRDGEDG